MTHGGDPGKEDTDPPAIPGGAGSRSDPEDMGLKQELTKGAFFCPGRLTKGKSGNRHATVRLIGDNKADR